MILLSKTLIITEKNSLAKNIASALKIGYRNGHYENDKFIMLACAGHLFGNKDANEYDKYKDIKGWANYALPIIPDEFEVKGVKGKENLIKNIKNALADKSVTDVIHWCDGDREGQLIGDEVLFKFKNKKPVTRAWHKDESDKSLLEAYNKRKPDSEYYNIYEEARARSEIDWLIGINATILASVKSGATIHLGRVKTPMLQYIYDREKAIAEFKPEPYFVVKNEKNIKLEYPEKFKTEAQAKEFAKKLNQGRAKVMDIKTKDGIVKPPLMFSLPTLQKLMNTKANWTPDKTMSVTQSVYDKKFITYVRADSEYLATEERGQVEASIKMLNDPRIKFNPNADTFNDKKILVHTAHHLTDKTPKAGDLTSDEQLIYDTIVNRLKCQFAINDRIVATTTMEIKVNDVPFKLSGKTVKSEGWGEFEKVTTSNNLPNLNVGDEFDVEFTVEKKMTTPPAKVTVNEMLDWCKAPFKKWTLDDVDENIELTQEELELIKKGVMVGTTATRDTILKSLITNRHVELKGKSYNITPLGKSVIDIKNKLNVSVNLDNTIEVEKWLTSIGKGEITREEVMSLVKKRLFDMVKLGETADIEKIAQSKNSQNIVAGCKCPKCGKDIIENQKAFACVDNFPAKKCDFVIWKNPNYFKHTITKSDIKALCNGKTIVMEATSKAGKQFFANYKLKYNAPYWNFELESFAAAPAKKTAKKTSSKK